jgi:hypothetical protein
MNNSNTYNWDRILQERGSFHPEAEYFMVDYLDANHGAHIRLPFLRREQVFEVFGVLEMAIQGGADLSSIRVLPERFLDEPYANLDIVAEAIAAGVEDAKFLGASTRQVLFDWRYEGFAKRFKAKSLAF